MEWCVKLELMVYMRPSWIGMNLFVELELETFADSLQELSDSIDFRPSQKTLLVMAQPDCNL